MKFHILVCYMTMLLSIFSTHNFLHANTNIDTPNSILQTLSYADLLNIEITTDLYQLINDRRREDYQKGIFTYKNAQGSIENRNIELRPRGKYRRMNCHFPPVKIKFDKTLLKNEGLLGFHELKLSTHCLEDEDQGNELAVKEYLAYQIYQTLTDKSFRTQLVRVTYRDSNGKMEDIVRYGFLIESEEELAARLGGSILESKNASIASLDQAQAHLAAVFQYMIGNTDWHLTMPRNTVLVETAKKVLIPVPYDFDFSALVAAPYAKPNPDLGLSNLQERAYMGIWEKDIMKQTVKKVTASRKIIIKKINQSKQLNWKSKNDMVSYLDSFFYNDIRNLMYQEVSTWATKNLRTVVQGFSTGL